MVAAAAGRSRTRPLLRRHCPTVLSCRTIGRQMARFRIAWPGCAFALARPTGAAPVSPILHHNSGRRFRSRRAQRTTRGHPGPRRTGPAPPILHHPVAQPPAHSLKGRQHRRGQDTDHGTAAPVKIEARIVRPDSNAPHQHKSRRPAKAGSHPRCGFGKREIQATVGIAVCAGPVGERDTARSVISAQTDDEAGTSLRWAFPFAKRKTKRNDGAGAQAGIPADWVGGHSCISLWRGPERATRTGRIGDQALARQRATCSLAASRSATRSDAARQSAIASSTGPAASLLSALRRACSPCARR